MSKFSGSERDDQEMGQEVDTSEGKSHRVAIIGAFVGAIVGANVGGMVGSIVGGVAVGIFTGFLDTIGNAIRQDGTPNRIVFVIGGMAGGGFGGGIFGGSGAIIYLSSSTILSAI